MKEGEYMCKIKQLLLSVLSALLVSGCSSVKQPDEKQAVFASGEAACAALTEAAKKNDTKRLMEIFGPQGEEIVFSGDEKLDAETRAYFAKNAEERTSIVEMEDEKGSYVVELGKEGVPFAVPLTQCGGTWFFNTPEGLDELLSRRIGRNEIFTINICESLVRAEAEYARKSKAAGGFREYAMKFQGDPGKTNGLYWDKADGKNESLVCADLVLASLSADDPQRKPYYGYYYKVLTAQGADAPGGKKSYLVDGKLVNGFAILAFPANYGVLGIKSFMVSKSGVVFEKDLGDNTDNTATATAEINPDDS